MNCHAVLLATIVAGLAVQRGVIELPSGLEWVIDHIAPLVAPTALTVTGFFLFLLLPFRRMSMRIIAVSAVTFGIMWELFRMALVFSLVKTFPNLDAIYGSLALLVTAASWLYYTSFAFVTSAVVGHSFLEACRIRDMQGASNLRGKK